MRIAQNPTIIQSPLTFQGVKKKPHPSLKKTQKKQLSRPPLPVLNGHSLKAFTPPPLPSNVSNCLNAV